MPYTPTLYRHDDIITARPYGIDVDPDGWLWEGLSGNRLLGHNLRTAERRMLEIPEMDGQVVYTVFAWQGKLILEMGYGPQYLVYDVDSRKAIRKPIAGDNPVAWYGSKMPNGKLMLCNRTQGVALILDGPEADARTVPFPYKGDFASINFHGDGLGYVTLADPARIVRFDPKTEKFIDEKALPWPEAAISGRIDHDGILYGADSAGGRLLPMDMKTQKWLDPIVHPDAGKVFGFIGGAFKCQGKSYHCLSTYATRSRLDLKTGKIVTPEGKLPTVDGYRPRFMEHLLEFDPKTLKFAYLTAPAQPDGVPLICYAWSDGEQFAVTGCLLQYEAPGVIGPEPGPWIVLQSKPADRVKGYTPYDFTFDRSQFLAERRRTYPRRHSLYLPEPQWSPPIDNMGAIATAYPPGKEQWAKLRAAATDQDEYFRVTAERLCRGIKGDEHLVSKILSFVKEAIYYDPIQEPQVATPLETLELHQGRCGSGVRLSMALMKGIDIKSRQVSATNHVTCEAFYDGSWHYADALFFGGEQPKKNGRVLSADELKTDIYYADAYPQDSFAYDPELTMSEDGYQVQGYVFGVWGSEPYYSFYLGAPKELPPTLPHCLPAQRVGEKTLRLNWSRSIKFDAPDTPGGEIEYDVRVFYDRECKQQVFHKLTRDTHADFDVPMKNRMYFMEVRAMDDHRKKNPNTWYPATRWNFVLVSKEQYGWYGVL